MDPLHIFLIIATLLLVFAIGAQDETMATIYGSGSLKLFWAMALGAMVSFIGVMFLSKDVGKTIGENLLAMPQIESDMVLAIVLGTAIWLLVATKTRAPISTTHSVVGSVVGVAVVWAVVGDGSLSQSLHWDSLGMILLGWIISPILGYFGAIIMSKIIRLFFKRKEYGLDHIEQIEKVFRYLIIAMGTFDQLSRAGNDAGNALGIFYSIAETEPSLMSQIPLFILISAILFPAGLVIFGRKLVANVGANTAGQFRPSEALAIETTTGLIIFVCTLLGLPVSGGHILIFSIIGFARTRGEKPDLKNLRKMIIAWTLTLPLVGILSGFIYFLLQL